MTYQPVTIKLLIPVVCLLILAGCLDKSYLPQPHSGPFDGEVIDSLTEEAIPGVTLEVGGQVLVTDSAGRFYLSNLAPGDYQITLSREWYQTGTGTLNYVGRPGEVTFRLQPEGLEGTIIYSLYYKPQKRDIYLLNLASRELQKIELPNSAETYPVALSKGQVFFQSDLNSATKQDELFSYDLKTQTMDLLCSSPAKEQHPSVDRNGTKLVFQSMRLGHWAIFLYDLSCGGEPVQLAWGQYPVLDPSGQRVAYVDGSNRLNIFTIGGGNEVVQYFDSAAKFSNPCWDPDGEMIAVESWVGTGGRRSIHIYSLADSSWRQLTFNNGLQDELHQHPCWSSQGDLLFFNAKILYKDRVDIYCVRVNEIQKNTPNGQWLLVSKGPGNKDYPSWVYESQP